MFRDLLTSISFFFCCVLPVFGQIDARMLRQPDVSATQIAFVYAGDIWVVPKSGGMAQRLSSPKGEESFPRFSPDGSMIAFNGNYDGNTDVYLIPAAGGAAKRLTHNPSEDRVLGWFPDGQSVLVASGMQSGRDRFNQLFKVSKAGGLPEKLPVPYGEFGTISPDGEWLAYVPSSIDFRTWKYYRGGWAPDVWLFNLKTLLAENITSNPANDSLPMWHGRTLYFISDRGPEQQNNIWAYELDGRKARQVTRFEPLGVQFPAIGPTDIVFESGGRLHLLNLKSERSSEVKVQVVTDEATLRPSLENVSGLIQSFWISPTGKRVVFEARGELFSVPQENGVILDLSRTPGAAERSPAWSPDGKSIAYFTDASGEYELAVRAADGSGGEEKLTSLGPGFRYRPYWSPDGKKLVFADQAMNIKMLDRDTRQISTVDKGLYMFHGDLAGFRAGWSPDSQWVAYSRAIDNRADTVFIFNARTGERRQVTSGYYDSVLPVFDPTGKYLYYLSSLTFRPYYSDIDTTWIYANTTRIVAVPLRLDVASPVGPRDDQEMGKGAEDKDKQKEQAKPDPKADQTPKPPEPVQIDFEGLEQRAAVLPAEAGNYGGLSAAEGKVVYWRAPRTGAPPESKGSVVYFDLEERKEETVVDGVDQFQLSADGKKLLVRKDRTFAILDLKPQQKIEKTLRTAELEMPVDPRAEWRQIFNDAWRLTRDYFYDPNMHGVDWNAMKERYSRLLESAVTRWDVNFVIGELIAELNASHTYRGGGDIEPPLERKVGMLGVDWALENGAYRIKRIIRGAPWEIDVKSPLEEAGANIKEGDYVLAVNGIALDIAQDPWAAFQGLAEQTIRLTVSSSPSMEGARQVIVKALAGEDRLRYLDWVETNRKYVEKATGGRVGYIYVPDTGQGGQTDLARQFRAQFDNEGLIIDERFNSGGQIPDRFIELLGRPLLARWAVRDGLDWQWPPLANFGPKAMLINGWSGSGGDAFPYYFREAGLGPLIGMRTWGGLIGLSGAPPLIDGGNVTVPSFRMYSPQGKWFEEGHGVDPDIVVVDDPGQMAKGKDPQLDRAIQEVMRKLGEKPAAKPARPAYENRSPKRK